MISGLVHLVLKHTIIEINKPLLNADAECEMTVCLYGNVSLEAPVLWTYPSLVQPQLQVFLFSLIFLLLS